MNKADPNAIAYVGSLNHSRDSAAWFTPEKYVEAARATMGRIDLDPFSDKAANKVVKARSILTETDDATTASWATPSDGAKRTVFMNPPYAAKIVAKAADRLIAELDSGVVTDAIVLVNNATETKWFQAMLAAASGVCFTSHRIAFWNVDGKAKSGNTRGQAFLYFGDDFEAFRRNFEPFGVTVPLS